MNKALDDSAFPELLLESAVNSVFPVFTNMKKDNTNQDGKLFFSQPIFISPVSVISAAGGQDRTFVTAKSDEVTIERVGNLINTSEEIRETITPEERKQVDEPEVPPVDDAQAQQIKEENKDGEESGFVTVDDNLEKDA